MHFETFGHLRQCCRDVPSGNVAAEAEALLRQAGLTKPAGSLGRLEELAIWMARWRGSVTPRIDQSAVLVFAGNHGVAERGVSAYPPVVTAQMVENFAAGGAAINQLARVADATLHVVPLALDAPTSDIVKSPAMSETEFLDAVSAGWTAVPTACDLIAIGEMGIGNTTIASALCAALIGGPVADWVGRGTGVDRKGLALKRSVVAAAVRRHSSVPLDPIASAAALGGRELAAILGAVLAARHHSIPVLLDGFVASAAVLPLLLENSDALAHCKAAHRSAEAAHGLLLKRLGLRPLLELDMRLGEGSGAAVAMLLVRAALSCHEGMASFESAGVTKTVPRPVPAVEPR